MNNLPMLVTMRGSKVRAIRQLVTEIWKLDSQIEEQRAPLTDEDSDALDIKIEAQDEEFLNVLTNYPGSQHTTEVNHGGRGEHGENPEELFIGS